MSCKLRECGIREENKKEKKYVQSYPSHLFCLCRGKSECGSIFCSIPSLSQRPSCVPGHFREQSSYTHLSVKSCSLKLPLSRPSVREQVVGRVSSPVLCPSHQQLQPSCVTPDWLRGLRVLRLSARLGAVRPPVCTSEARGALVGVNYRQPTGNE